MEPCSWPPAHNWFCSRILSVSPCGHVVCYGAKNHLVVVETAAAAQQRQADNRQETAPKCTVVSDAFDDRTRVSVG